MEIQSNSYQGISVEMCEILAQISLNINGH